MFDKALIERIYKVSALSRCRPGMAGSRYQQAGFGFVHRVGGGSGVISVVRLVHGLFGTAAN
ncbi:hypothetical protein [Rhodococcus sp. UNC363MFTsu5.1]|uniref:hypothetical protein n=1 Tax=Rhodococcus sp. UNC363MFTsu5.1 TaxID=1449069 RepID=UPI000485D9DE|nr:hypothetical protein [Rhodococcus sp. UNC363MFTsu5.1]